jgi:hypothetical protein
MREKHMPAPEVRAATRDASWYRNPSTHGSIRYHVVAPEIHKSESACGLPLVVSECRGDLGTTRPASGVPAAMRCGRPGCRARWPAEQEAHPHA